MSPEKTFPQCWHFFAHALTSFGVLRCNKSEWNGANTVVSDGVVPHNENKGVYSKRLELEPAAWCLAHLYGLDL